ncbi:MAG: malto-oligosyltrehalose synthase, partial [Kiloniellaceae bacterium]
MTDRNLPRATYRLQFRNGMDFDRAASLAPYLARLGVSHLYASPLFAAAEGSTHGYDGVDVTVMEPALGGDAGFERLCAALREAGLSLLLDFVPNHMAAVESNAWWWSVLEWGEASAHARVFDIDWSASKLMLPVLGAGYGEALESGVFGLGFDAGKGRLGFRFYDRTVPLTPPSYARVLSPSADPVLRKLGQRFAETTPESGPALQRDLAEAARAPAVSAAIADALSAAQSDTAALHEIHEAQVWRLAHWRLAREALTHRRFFEIAELVGLRVEDPAVFAQVHERLFQLIRDGQVAGVRLDHVDGLSDPKGYFERFQETVGCDGDCYLLVEKILEPGEPLRPDWAVAGTTGYEFIAALADVFADSAGCVSMTAAYDSFVGRASDYAGEAAQAKREILGFNLAGELADLTAMARDLAAQSIATRDLGEDALKRSITEIIVHLPVYRSYIVRQGPDALDRRYLQQAVDGARTSEQTGEPEAVAFVAGLLLPESADDEERPSAEKFVARFQQTTGPVMAKAIEDTLFYRYNRLVALNEVGGAADHFGAPLADFHAAMTERQASQPAGLSATATHDTKRGEDARARLYALSEMPGRWRQATARWSAMNARHRIAVPEGDAPEPEIEWLFYQALAGAWPAALVREPLSSEAAVRELSDLRERFLAYMEKACREAKSRTTWTNTNKEYEEAVAGFVSALLTVESGGEFLTDFAKTCTPLWLAGAVNSLSQLALKLTAPGIPDIYQGCELWDFSLTDPDNRRPVDFHLRESLLDEGAAGDTARLMEDWLSGAPKMALLAAGLRARRQHPQLFAEGRYEPLEVKGARAENLVAFQRRAGDKRLVVVVPRKVLG